MLTQSVSQRSVSIANCCSNCNLNLVKFRSKYLKGWPWLKRGRVLIEKLVVPTSGPAVIVKVSFDNRLYSVFRQCIRTCECMTNCWSRAHTEGACIIGTGKVICNGYDSYEDEWKKSLHHISDAHQELLMKNLLCQGAP